MYCQSCSLLEEFYPEYVKRDNPGKWENDLREHFKSRAIKTSTEHIKKCWRLQSSETFRLKKITLRYHFTPTKITKKGRKTPNAGEGVEEQKLSSVAGGSALEICMVVICAVKRVFLSNSTPQ